MSAPSPRAVQLLALVAAAFVAGVPQTIWAADPDTVSVILIDGDVRQGWPDPGVVGFHRTTTGAALVVNFAVGGTAVAGTDYTTTAVGTTITIPATDLEAWIEFAPKNVTMSPAAKTITVTLLPATNAADYNVSTAKTEKAATVNLSNARMIANGSLLPGAKEAVRFINQAGFGPNADFKNVNEVMTKGFDKWLTEQFAKPVGLQQPYLDRLDRAAHAKKEQIYSDAKILTWWKQAMNTAATADPLRQRVAFALSEIMVISDHLDDLGNQPIGMVNYYDMLLKGAFGNFRTLLFNVGTHPAMGTYLNHLGNEKGNNDPVNPTYADENFAREIIQLFSIGLWDLNLDGTPKLDANNQPVQSYDNTTIANMAKVMTGFSFGGKKGDDFRYPSEESFTAPMRMWDAFHDLTAKTLLPGPTGVVVTLPARTRSDGDPDTGALGMADFNAAIDCLFNHPNCAPFISKQLIQKLVTSNPTPAYVQRVATVFNTAPRGDLKAVIRAILVDPEARQPSVMASASSGKMKEPYLRTANLLRALNAKAANGVFDLKYLEEVHFQQPLAAPSVFNFFKPGYSPSGPINDQNLVAPEFQILNAVTATAVPNYYFHALQNGFFNYYGADKASALVKPALTAELAVAGDVPALLRRLDLILTGGTLPKEEHEVIREAVQAITSDLTDDWKRERVRMAIYLISTSPEFGILK